VFIQSFEVHNLQRLHNMTKLRLVQLLVPSGEPVEPAVPERHWRRPGPLRLFFRLGVDGLFTDYSDVAVAVRTKVFG
jgi:glycerophosphoryl diester phosphodiesterase